jgi:hypothetical protein
MPSTIIKKELYLDSSILASINIAIYKTYLHIYFEIYFDDMQSIIFPNVKLLENYDIDKVVKSINDRLSKDYCSFFKDIKEYVEIDDSDREYFIDFVECKINEGIISKSEDNIYSFTYS